MISFVTPLTPRKINWFNDSTELFRKINLFYESIDSFISFGNILSVTRYANTGVIMYKVVVFLMLLFLGVGTVFSQNTRTADGPKIPKPQYQSFKKEKKGFFSFLKKETKNQSDKSEIEEFRDRLKKVYKTKAKEEKLADKKRYKEHGYFGHKKPPKKRPPEKMKYCKVCQLKH